MKTYLLLLALLMAGCNQLNTCPCVVVSYDAKKDLKGNIYYNYRIVETTENSSVMSSHSSKTFYNIGDTIK